MVLAKLGNRWEGCFQSGDKMAESPSPTREMEGGKK